MDTDKKTIKALNTLLQGEYMAIESFNNFIPKLDDATTKDTFKDVQNQHRGNIKYLVGYIHQIGGQPKENLGFKGKMADMKFKMQFGSKVEKVDLIEKAMKGELRGINKTEKMLRGKLDDKSRDIVGEVLQKDRISAKRINGLIQ